MNACMEGYAAHIKQSIPSLLITTPVPGNGMSRFLKGTQHSSSARAPFGDTE